MATGQTTLRQALIEGINRRGLERPNSKFPNAPIISTGWKHEYANSIAHYLDSWKDIIPAHSTKSILDMTLEEFYNPATIKYVVKQISADKKKFKHSGNLERVVDQLLDNYTDFRTGHRPFGEYFKKPEGKQLKEKTKIGTGRGQTSLNLPNDIYAEIGKIEDIIAKSTGEVGGELDKLTAMFMNMTGHRGEETGRLLIDNFTKKSDVSQGSNYGTKWNLHASGWVLKQKPKKVHFSPLEKLVILKALEIAEKEGRTSGPLFPNASKVDSFISKAFTKRYGEKSLEAYVEGETELKQESPTRKIFRRLKKGRFAIGETISAYTADRYRDMSKIMQGIAISSVEGKYPVVNENEVTANEIGRISDDAVIAYSGSGSSPEWIKKHNFTVPSFLDQFINPIPNIEYIARNSMYLQWMGPELVAKILQQQPITGINYELVDWEEIKNSQKEWEEITKIQRKSQLTNARYEQFVTYNTNLNTLIKHFEADGLSSIEAKVKAESVLSGKWHKRKQLTAEQLQKINDSANPVLTEQIKDVMKKHDKQGVDASTAEGKKIITESIWDLISGKKDGVQKFIADSIATGRNFVENPPDISGQIADLDLGNPEVYKKAAAAVGVAAADAIVQTASTFGGKAKLAGRTAGQIGKGAAKFILPGNKVEGKMDLFDTTSEIHKDQNPAFQQLIAKKKEEDRIEKLRETVVDTEYLITKDMQEQKTDQIIGDRDPESDFTRQMHGLFGP